ncbi:MAG: hypothetical protein PHY59_00935 [Methanobacterium sp.]|nr:hypothetical protein [Methanobacterium sp.]
MVELGDVLDRICQIGIDTCNLKNNIGNSWEKLLNTSIFSGFINNRGNIV